MSNNIIRDFPSRLKLKISNLIMLDNDVNKMLYYNKIKNKDIYSLEDIEDPIGELKNNKVFIDRRVDKVLKESDITVFINLSKDTPYTRNYTKSRKVRTCEIEIGVICHRDCRETINGMREEIVFSRIKEILQESNISTLGEISWGDTSQMYNMPFEYNGYSTKILVDYFGKM